jgi:hypothetical protein
MVDKVQTGPDLEGGKWSGRTGPPILEGSPSRVHIYIVLGVVSGAAAPLAPLCRTVLTLR